MNQYVNKMKCNIKMNTKPVYNIKYTTHTIIIDEFPRPNRLWAYEGPLFSSHEIQANFNTARAFVWTPSVHLYSGN